MPYRLDAKSGPSATTIDLGGGSVQESYAISTADFDENQVLLNLAQTKMLLCLFPEI